MGNASFKFQLAQTHGLAAILDWVKILKDILSLELLPQLTWNLTIMIYSGWRIYVLNFNLIEHMVWQPELYNFLNLGSFWFFFWIRLIWLCLDGFEGRRVASEIWILSSWLFILLFNKVPPDYFIFDFCLFRFLVITPIQDCTYLGFHLIWIEFILIPFWIKLNNNKCHGSGSGVQSKSDVLVPGHHCQQL